MLAEPKKNHNKKIILRSLSQHRIINTLEYLVKLPLVFENKKHWVSPSNLYNIHPWLWQKADQFSLLATKKTFTEKKGRVFPLSINNILRNTFSFRNWRGRVIALNLFSNVVTNRHNRWRNNGFTVQTKIARKKILPFFSPKQLPHAVKCTVCLYEKRDLCQIAQHHGGV